MFDKTIKIVIKGVKITLTNQEVKDHFLNTVTLLGQEQDRRKQAESLQVSLARRLDAANVQLKKFGHPGDI